MGVLVPGTWFLFPELLLTKQTSHLPPTLSTYNVNILMGKTHFKRGIKMQSDNYWYIAY